LTAPSLSTPDVVPEGGQFIEATYSNPAGTRAYKLYIPSGYHGQALPLVVMLHGCTQSPDDFAAGTRMNLIGLHQSDVALRDHFGDRQAVAAIAHGDLGHQAQMAGESPRTLPG
jgi:hypothetical protein